jgi:choice-of-anchor C domain-containing protein
MWYPMSPKNALEGRLKYIALALLVVVLAGLIAGVQPGLVNAARPQLAALPPSGPNAACVPPVGNIVQNGSFETPVRATYITYFAPATFGSWTVGSGSVDLEPSWQDYNGNQSLDLAGSSQGSVYQDLCTMPGIQYQLSFALAGNPNETPTTKTMEVWWAGQKVSTQTFSTVGRTTTSMGWTVVQMTVQASATTTRLMFRDGYIGTTRSGPALDDVSVTALPGQMTATPTPCVPASGNMVQNGSFETPAAGATGNLDIYAPGTVDGWIVGSGSVGVTNWWQNAHGLQALDLAGNSQGSIYQDICTTPGELYQLSFAFAGNPAENPTLKTMELWWGAQNVATLQFSTVGRSVSNMGWVIYDYTLQATGTTTRLLFKDVYVGTTRSGPALDAVSLQAVPATPTPTATASSTATATATSTPTSTATAGPGSTATTTATATATATASSTATATATATASSTATTTATATATAPASSTPPTTPTSTATATATAGPSSTATATAPAAPTGTPAAGQKTQLYLPLIIKIESGFPIPINRVSIATRPVIKTGEIYYSMTLALPPSLPSGGHFYLSTAPDSLAAVKVDDEIVVILDGQDAYRQFLTYSKIVEVPSAQIVRWADATSVRVEFRDRYGSVVGSQPVWLIWRP